MTATYTHSETAPATAPAPAPSADAPDPAATARLRAYARVRVEHLPALWQRACAVAVGDDTSVWSATPDSPADLVRYAREGRWCSPESILWRLAGRIYTAVVAVPVTVAAYALLHIVQRPGRVAAAAFLAAIVLIFVIL